jgi:hypothetical protein
MKILNIICLVSLTIWLTSCFFKGFSQPFETTVQVLDMGGKPIAGRTVRLTTSTSPSSFIDTKNIKQELVTNNDGKAIFNYDLSISDSHSEFAQFVCKDDNTWKAIAFEEHSLSNRQSKIVRKQIQLQMDSLKPLKIRLSSNRNDLIRYKIATFFSTFVIISPNNKLIAHDLDLLSRDRKAASLDTIFTVKIFSKHSFVVSAVTEYNSEPKTWSYRTIFTDKMNRDSIYWIQLL